MSHIAIDARTISTPNGRYVERLLHYLQEIDEKNSYSVLVLNKDKNFWKPTADNFKVIVADFDNYSIQEQIGYKKFLEDLAPDLVHFCLPQQPILYKGKSVTTFHDLNLLKTSDSDKKWYIFRFKQAVGKYVYKYVARNCQYIITPTLYTKEELMKYAEIPSSKITVANESIETSYDKPKPYKMDFEQYILYVGKQSDYKNIKRLGRAHQRLLEKYPDLGLVLVGNLGIRAKKNQKYFQDKEYKNILFTGFITDDKRDWLYKNASAYILPSLSEGFGLPGLEAMVYGTPVISSNAASLPEVFGDAAHYFDPLSTKDITRAIDEVLSSPKLQGQLIEKGKKQIKKYSWRKMTKETKRVYDSALGFK